MTFAEDVLRVLAWPGYADPDIVKTFEQRTGAKVEVTYIDSDEALWQRIAKNKGEEFDVFAVNTAELQRYIQASLVRPISTKSISNTAHQLPRFRDLKSIPGVVHGGQVFAMPYTYSEMGLIYDRQQVKTAPTSIKVLWDKQYRGKVLLYNVGTHNFSLAAQILGDTTPFRIDTKEWPAAVRQLIALRRNAMAFYTQPEESVELFKRGKAALLFANYGSQQITLLKKAGVDVGYAIPSDGALAWLDCWAITRGVRNDALAHSWINYMLEAEPAAVLLSRQGLANTRTESPFLHPDDRLVWLEPVESVERRTKLWERIVSGDRESKVLAP
ncbi:MAG: extracellular solute-binding protein [Burkholderiales bacterium]|nr:extracellular solute-binding protein [Burkholderiales bacterium]